MPKYSTTHEGGLDPEYKRQRMAQKIREASDMQVTIDRISNSGNPIAAQKHEGSDIHVPGALEGETVFIKLKDKKSSRCIGQIVNPTDSQEERVEAWKKRIREKRKRRKKAKKEKKKKKRKKVREQRKKSWKGQNKNHLIRHKP
jgi:tRNA/tmRNA/rRNA uracil-C5-methylase (TrmA/RlmC/RlmD family)